MDIKTVRAARRAALYLRRTSYNAFVGAGFYPARGRGRVPPLRTIGTTARLVCLRRGDPCDRPREGQSPSPTHRKIRFHRAGCPQPAARQPPHHHGGVRARRPTQVFRHFRRGGRFCPPARASTAPHVELPVIAKPVRTLAVAIRLPRPKASRRSRDWGIPLYTAPLVTDAGRCGHRPLRNPIGKPFVGADAPVRPPIPYRTHGKARVPCPTKMPCRAGPMCPAARRTPCMPP